MLSNELRDRLQIWVTAVSPRAIAFARSLTSDPDRAEDLVQECLFRLIRRAETYDLEQDGIPLLFKSISNLCINRAVREKAIHSLNDADGWETADSSAYSPDRILQDRELEASIQDGLAALPPMQRAAVELRALGMSNEKISEVLDVSPSNAGVLVFRGRKALEAELSKKSTSEGKRS